ncbi:hypothetical protein BKA65DRAFT_470854 [Rhexocercosporidium sp. MPI-PUGE-AT-0058]|nr:hypothetical protein BKA65DRAFT_470854 [Rhexocercosporidium sp. MPI-PUGE-AT-0058]
MLVSSQGSAMKKGTNVFGMVAVESPTRDTGRSFDSIAKKTETSDCEVMEKQQLPEAKGSPKKRNMRRSRVGNFYEEIPVEETNPSRKTRPEFPVEKYHQELVNIQARLDLVTSAKLIQTYNILERQQDMHSRLKSLRERTAGLMIELKNRKKIYTVANRLVSGDGLDSKLGRLDRDVMWFIAELRYRQMDCRSSTTLVDRVRHAELRDE